MAAHRTQLLGAATLDEGARAEVAPRARAFFGLPMPDEHRGAMAGFLTACAEAAPRFRWTPPGNLHITVRFIGQVDRAVVDEIADRLAGRSLAGFDLQLGAVGTFRRGRLVRVVWQGLHSGAEAATALAAEVEAECMAVGLESEKRPFQAHLTLARARSRDGAELPPLPAPPDLRPWRANELILYSSHLGRTGAIYEPLRIVKLD